MSKLYDAIDRLEQIAEDDIPLNLNPDKSQRVEPRRHFVLLRPVLFALLIILSGIAVWGGCSWLGMRGGNLHQKQSATKVPGGDNIIVSVPVASALSLQTEISPESEDKNDQTKQGAGGLPAAVVSTATSENNHQEEENVLEKVALQPNIVAVKNKRTEEVIPAGNQLMQQDKKVYEKSEQPLEVKNNSVGSIEEPQPLAHGDWQMDEEKIKHLREVTFAKRLLQAEQRRSEKDWMGAVLLYRQMWETSNNSDIANNLAASLLKLHDAVQAVEVLEVALAQAPDDKDLQRNLQYAKQQQW